MLRKEEKKGIFRRFLWIFALLCIIGMIPKTTVTVSAATNIKLNHSTYVLKKGKSYKFVATILKSKYKKRKIYWTSSKKSVATVSSKGTAKAKKNGTTTITARIKGTSYKAKCKLIVGKPITKLEAVIPSKPLEEGKKYKITTKITPSNASVKTLSYKSSDTSIANISSDGYLTAVAPGKVNVTISAKDGSGKKVVLALTICEKIDVISLSSAVSQKTMKMMNLIEGYSSFIKKYGSLCAKNGSSPTASYSKAKTNAEAGSKVYLNCTTPANWALKEMGILSSSGNLYGTPSGFKNSTARTDLSKYGSFINSGTAMGLSVQEAAEKDALQYGDLISIGINGSMNHMVVYAGLSSTGHALVYEAGGIAEGKGYAKVGCGPLDYSTASSSKYVYKITEIYRLK